MIEPQKVVNMSAPKPVLLILHVVCQHK